ncbi:MAG: hypothetical protein Q8M15_16955 [Bacteroidota bacterium]|nr:hypothetical protein [Bacteroidota bacterium]
MNTVPTITLDTNCIINLIDFTTKSPISVEALSEIIRYGLLNVAQISIITRVESDLLKDKNSERKAEMLRKISMFPIVGAVTDGDDLKNELQKILFPGLTDNDPRFHNKITDIEHLVGHKINGRDIFVTDDKSILKKSDILKKSPGIIVLSPEDCLKYIEEIEDKKRKVVLRSKKNNPDYESTKLSGIVTFDYSNNEHQFNIGEGYFLFETLWSKGSNSSIHSYRNPPSISAIALVKDKSEIQQIKDAVTYDYSSRSRTVLKGQILLLKNKNGFYAAIKILKVKSDTHGFDRDELTFEYFIQSDNTSSFNDAPKSSVEIKSFAAHVVQIGGIDSRNTTKTCWSTEGQEYFDFDELASISFNRGGDIMGLAPKEGYKISDCSSPSGNPIINEEGYPLGCRIMLEDKLKNEIIIYCEKI